MHCKSFVRSFDEFVLSKRQHYRKFRPILCVYVRADSPKRNPLNFEKHATQHLSKDINELNRDD